MRKSTLTILSLFLTISIFFINLPLKNYEKVSAQSTSSGTHIKLQVNNPPPIQANTNPPVSTSTKRGGGERLTYSPFFESLIIIPTPTSVLINWKSNIATKSILSWGKTSNYEEGSVAEINLNLDHSIKLNELNPETRYYFKIESTDENGKMISYQDQFFTIPVSDNTAPSNVTEIKFNIKNNQLVGSWKNPKDLDFEKVRVIRSKEFYPQDPNVPKNDEKIIYDGAGSSLVDSEISYDTNYYYTFFSQDSSGNYSSGALARVRVTLINNFLTIGTSTSSHIDTSISSINENKNSVFLTDFEIIQAGKQLSFTGDVIKVQSDEPIIMRLPKENLIPDAQYVLLSIEDEDNLNNKNKFNSYYIRTLTNQSYIEADIPAFKIVDKMDKNISFFITFLNKDRKVLDQLNGTFNVTKTSQPMTLSWWQRIFLGITQIIKWLMGLLTRFLNHLL